MSRETFDKNSAPIIAAAEQWRDRCLIGDRSIFGDTSLWTAEHLAALDQYFVQRPYEGSGSFYEKLQGQLAPAPAPACCLMAEVLWVLFLFPSNISIETKREGILRVWGWSGEALDPRHPMLADSILNGIGSAGMGVNTNRWREVVYIISLGETIKGKPADDRKSALATYENFVEWIRTVPYEGERQFRHMLRYFLFPDRVERISSNGDRRRVLAAFDVATSRVTSKWTDRQLDDALLQLRGQLEAKHGTKVLDFYRPPLRDVWKGELETDEPQVEEPREAGGVREEPSIYVDIVTRPVNLILYGPPGTGKTYRLQQLIENYTDLPADIDRNTWAQELLARYGWREAIAATLADLGSNAKVAAIENHSIIRAKALQRARRGGVTQTLWGYLQTHTPPDVETVKLERRREPFLFTKTSDSAWTLLPGWQDQDRESAELYDAWKTGPGAIKTRIERYRIVTFHPSYSYEDFVIGLRPVAASEEESGDPTQFRLMDGVFKQVCALARANPAKRYALFIDEINRANIAKVFGELITLIESDKRARYDETGSLLAGVEVQLPGTGGSDDTNIRFGVPHNLDIYGTMNTADRSIALLDIALRRRFDFEEMEPRYDLLERSVEGVQLAALLRRINDRLEFLIDRDHRIGHAYLIKVKTLEELRQAFQRQIIPLLQEYFFDDWGRVVMVLSDGSGESPFVRCVRSSCRELFGIARDGLDEIRDRHETTTPESWTAEAFTSVYSANN